jgi:hypothetical protein
LPIFDSPMISGNGYILGFDYGNIYINNVVIFLKLPLLSAIFVIVMKETD